MSLLATLAAGSCSDEGDAPAIWDLTNNEVHRIHVAAFANDAQPALVSSHPCVLGGSVEMTLVYEGEPSMDTLRELGHTFIDCRLDDSVVNGRLDYLDLSFCDNGAPSFTIDGMLTLSGGLQADCAIVGTEVCGKATGTVCGEKAR